MTKKRKFTAAGLAALALAGGGSGLAFATANGEKDPGEYATGSGADRAEAAALKITGGEANAVERDSENGATWEVEVTKPGGATVDVRLDESYGLVVIESDKEDANGE